MNKQEDNKETYNYYTGTNVINGLKECIYYIEEVTPENERGQYHYELISSLKDCIKQLDK